MSSLRNAVKRITHKERAQPQSRSHLGMLEKKKDYRLRAADYHRKEDQIKMLKEKAAMRNPDEFYFGMHNAEVKDGAHRRTLEAQHKQLMDQIGGLDTIRLMKDQDLSYIRMQKQKDKKKVEQLRSSLHYLDQDVGAIGRKHTVFVESQEEAKDFDAAKHFDTLPELVNRSFHRPRIETLKKMAGVTSNNEDVVGVDLTKDELVEQSLATKKLAKKISKARSSAYREVEARKKRINALQRAEAHLITEKLVSGKGTKRKIKEAENGMPAQFKWKRKRAK